jgi:hypothetical protein
MVPRNPGFAYGPFSPICRLGPASVQILPFGIRQGGGDQTRSHAPTAEARFDLGVSEDNCPRAALVGAASQFAVQMDLQAALTRAIGDVLCLG